MDLKIRLVGESILRKKSWEVKVFDQELQNLLESMKEKIMESWTFGLSAVQVGFPVKVFVMWDGKNYWNIINPEIIEYSKNSSEYEETCLSLPGIEMSVIRPDTIKVRYFDENGIKKEEEFFGRTARIFQHEYDHLEGKLFIDNISEVDKIKIKNKIMKIISNSKKTK